MQTGLKPLNEFTTIVDNFIRDTETPFPPGTSKKALADDLYALTKACTNRNGLNHSFIGWTNPGRMLRIHYWPDSKAPNNLHPLTAIDSFAYQKIGEGEHTLLCTLKYPPMTNSAESNEETDARITAFALGKISFW